MNIGNEERLDEIKEDYDEWISWAKNSWFAELNEDELLNIKWLIEQAERVQELEALQSDSKMNLQCTIHNLRNNKRDLEQQNNRYREAIGRAIEEINDIDRMPKPIGNPMLSGIVGSVLCIRGALINALEGESE